MRTALVLSLVLLAVPWGRAETPQNEARAVVTAFADGLRDRNIAHVQKAVGTDVVAILDGTRYDGWGALRDRGLIPEFAHPPAPGTWQIVNLSGTGDVAWAYTRTSLGSRNRGERTVWTVFVLERRGKEWKIVLVDRSAGRDATAAKKKAGR
jgi:ketosteroid isomerase-like protein